MPGGGGGGSAGHHASGGGAVRMNRDANAGDVGSIGMGRSGIAPVRAPMRPMPPGFRAPDDIAVSPWGVPAEPAGGHYMRRIWVRRGSVAAGRVETGADRTRIEAARQALLAVPDSRDRHRDLYRALSIAGEFDEAADIATRWSTRDALDPEAITRLADMAARRGDRDRAVRLLAGIVDVRPDDVTGLTRLAQLHERAGEQDEACAFRVSIAQLRAWEADSFTPAVRCERALGHAASATRLLLSLTDATLRQRVEAAASVGGSAGVATQGPARGEVTVQASWDAPVDLDVALIDPTGNRISWMGGRTGVTASNVRGLRGEGLGLARGATGEYTVEITRTASSDQQFVRGQLELGALGDHRTVAFALAPGSNAERVARITITRESQLVPLN
jgi:hypothetical protein